MGKAAGSGSVGEETRDSETLTKLLATHPTVDVGSDEEVGLRDVERETRHRRGGRVDVVRGDTTRYSPSVSVRFTDDVRGTICRGSRYVCPKDSSPNDCYGPNSGPEPKTPLSTTREPRGVKEDLFPVHLHRLIHYCGVRDGGLRSHHRVSVLPLSPYRTVRSETGVSTREHRPLSGSTLSVSGLCVSLNRSRPKGYVPETHPRRILHVRTHPTPLRLAHTGGTPNDPCRPQASLVSGEERKRRRKGPP